MACQQNDRERHVFVFLMILDCMNIYCIDSHVSTNTNNEPTFKRQISVLMALQQNFQYNKQLILICIWMYPIQYLLNLLYLRWSNANT